MAPPRRFVLLDRDGTLNVERHYLSDPDQLALIPGAGAAIRRLREAGFGVAVVTNQSGIARGYFTLARLDEIHDRLRALLAAEGAAVDGIYVCPHGPGEECDCRKPLPGLALRAAAEHGFRLDRAFVVGDKAADVALGHAVGAVAILVRTGHGRDQEAAGVRSDHIVDDLPAAVELILRLAREERGGLEPGPNTPPVA
jgi:D-glycero-D-manno-heptose 1,7-bisphosphate phosphatase